MSILAIGTGESQTAKSRSQTLRSSWVARRTTSNITKDRRSKRTREPYKDSGNQTTSGEKAGKGKGKSPAFG